MTLNVHIRGIKADDQLKRQLEADLKKLNRLVPLVFADVMLQYQREVAPPYQVVAMLNVPGPGIHAAARDHTWFAAWSKVVARLREQIEERQHWPSPTEKSRLRSRTPASHRDGGKTKKL